jgi:hypothetical protein
MWGTPCRASFGGKTVTADVVLHLGGNFCGVENVTADVGYTQHGVSFGGKTVTADVGYSTWSVFWREISNS